MKAGGNEAHITADREHARVMQEVAEVSGWVFSQITGCPLLGQGTYCYLTGYDRDAIKLKSELNNLCSILTANNVPVLRAKIEHIVFDSKTGVNEL